MKQNLLLKVLSLGLSVATTVFASDINLSGWVGDASGAGIAGVEVALKDSSFSTTTDSAGNWSLVRMATTLVRNVQPLAKKSAEQEVFNVLGRKMEGTNLARGVYVVRNVAGISRVQVNRLAKLGAVTDSLIVSYQSDVVGRIGVVNLTGVIADMTLRMVSPVLEPSTAGIAPSSFYALVGQTAHVDFSFDTLLWRPAWLTVGSAKIAATGSSFSIVLSNATDSVKLALASRVQSIVFLAPSEKTYGDANFLLTASTNSNLEVSFSSLTPLVCAVNGVLASVVGAGVCTIQASQTGDANFNLAAMVTQSFTVEPKPLTVTGAVALDKVYDGTTTATIASATLFSAEVLGADNVSLNVGSATFVDANVGNNKAVTGLSLLGTDAANYRLLVNSNITAAITPKPLTVTGAAAASKVYDGTAYATITGATLSEIVGTDDVSLNVGLATFTDANAGTDKTVTVTSSRLNGASAANYSLTEIGMLTATITPKPLTVTDAAAASKVYDGTTSAIITGATLVGIEGTDVVTVGTATFADANVGTDKVVTIASASLCGANATNYTLIEISGLTASITAKPLTVIGSMDANKIYDGKTIAMIKGAILSGIVGTDAVTLNVGTATFTDADVGTGKTVTVTNSNISGAKATNYNLTEISGVTATITPKPLTVTGAKAASKVYDGTSVAIITGAILSGIVGTDDVALNVGTANFVDANAGVGKSVTVTGSSLSGAKAMNYRLIEILGLTASITKISITVTPNAFSKYAGDPDPIKFTYTSAGILLGNDAFAGSLTRATGEAVGNYAIIQGTLSLSNNYSLNVVGGVALSIFGNTQTCPYNATAKTLSCGEKIYKTVTIIGTGYSQVWMAENLAWMPSISALADNSDVVAKYYLDNATTYNTYGALYNYQAALHACPIGWHLPTDEEWTSLESALGGSDIAGTALKSVTGWTSGETIGTNTSGFSALPGGLFHSGSFINVGNYGTWWTTLNDGISFAYFQQMFYGNTSVELSYGSQSNGFSARCLKDQ